MKLLIKNILVGIAVIPLFFHIIILCVNVLCSNVEIRDDISHYKSRKSIKYNLFFTFVYLMLIFPEFRNIFYMRMGRFWRYLLFWFPPLSTLHIWTPSARIGGGLYIGHGWGTVINTYRVGRNCVIGQNCTIGSRNFKEPVLEDNVKVWAHAVVLGDIVVEENSNIGAGAVVVKNVPKNSVVVPAKSSIIRMNGEKVNILL